MKKKTILMFCIAITSVFIILILCFQTYHNSQTSNGKYKDPTMEELDKMTPEEQVREKVRKLQWILNNGELSKLSLTIYYQELYGYLYWITDLDELISFANSGNAYCNRIDIDGAELKNNRRFLDKITENTIVPAEETQHNDHFRIYYEIKYNDETILTVAMWSWCNKIRIQTDEDVYTQENSVDYPIIYVNGVLIKEFDVYYKVIMPYIPYNQAKKLFMYYS